MIETRCAEGIRRHRIAGFAAPASSRPCPARKSRFHQARQWLPVRQPASLGTDWGHSLRMMRFTAQSNAGVRLVPATPAEWRNPPARRHSVLHCRNGCDVFQNIRVNASRPLPRGFLYSNVPISGTFEASSHLPVECPGKVSRNDRTTYSWEWLGCVFFELLP